MFLFSGEMHPYRYTVFTSMRGVYDVHVKFPGYHRSRFTWIYSRKSSLWVSIQFRSMCSGALWSLSGAKSLSKDSGICNLGLMPQNRPASTSWLDLVGVATLSLCDSLTFPLKIGPYINAETSAGGFPGWGTYTPGLWRTSNTTYFEAWQNYVSTIGNILAENQITNGGPVILVQVSLPSLCKAIQADTFE